MAATPAPTRRRRTSARWCSRRLTYAPSGAVVAAATTSLPERRAGDANWDYRYAWLRDASFVLNAFWVAACPDEADRYFQWMARAAGTATGEGTQVVFGVEGERRLDEAELGHLAGFGGARPVRVGNDAWRQTQLDVYGAVLDAAWAFRERLDADPLVHRFLCGLADGAAARWGDRDAGIWEDRDCERHNVSSKTMCWLALDRAVRLAERLGAGGGQVARWARERDRVRDAVLRRGWSDERGAYVGAFDSPRLDASVLLMPMVGLVDARDERVLATVRAIERELGTERGLLRRLEDVDEGAFLACSFWLAQCHALAGDTDRARDVFEAAAATAGDVGLLAEQADPADGALLGNVPQALSHASLVNAAWCIDEVERGRR
jgi:GH15 family glucan-1,4-alpha-glucosidase